MFDIYINFEVKYKKYFNNIDYFFKSFNVEEDVYGYSNNFFLL